MKNPMRKIMRAAKELSYNVSEPRKARRRQGDINALKLVRQTNHLRIPDTYEKMSDFDKELQTARARAKKVRKTGAL